MGDSFSVPVSVTTGQNTTSYSVSWSYPSVFKRTRDTFVVAENRTGTFSIEALITFTGSTAVGNETQPFTSTLTTAESVTVIPLIISLQTQLINVTDSHGFVERNPDGSFYHNDSFCDSWSATFPFAAQRTDVKINVTSAAPPSLRVLNHASGSFGRTGEYCYGVGTGSPYDPFKVMLKAEALNWEGVSLALKESSQPFAVVRYDPQFTTYAYMEYRNNTEPSSFERPWVLFVGYDGNSPGYSYTGDPNTAPFNGSTTLRERAYFDSFRFSTLSYQPFTTDGGVFDFHVTNSTGIVQYEWLNADGSAPLDQGNPIEKYVFEATSSSLSPLLASGYAYQNVTMIGCWQSQGVCDMRQNYWLVPFLWNGRVNVVSVDSSGNLMPDTQISVTIQNPSPLDEWLTANFEQVFGNDQRALRAFESDLYPTAQTMSFSGMGSLSLLLNQTSLVPPLISITAGETTTSGSFTFTPTIIGDTIASAPDPLNGTIYYANATIPLWSYNMVQGSLAYLPISVTAAGPSEFLELVNSSSLWVAGSTTEPQTPSAFGSQEYGFWPMGENLTIYVNMQGGGVNLLGVQKIGPNEYQASFYAEPLSGGISSAQLVDGNGLVENESLLNTEAYPSPLPQGLTGLLSLTYPATGQDAKAVFTNVWGATTTVDLGNSTAAAPPNSLIPETTAAAFGVAGMVWLVVSGLLRTKPRSMHE